MKKCVLYLIYAAVILSYSPQLKAKPEFDVVIYPWVMEQTSHEFRSENQAALKKSRESLANSLGKIVQLDKIYQKSKNPLLNISKQLKNYLSVKQENQDKGILLIQPYICRLNDKLLVGNLIHRAKTRKLEALSHSTLPIKIKYEANELETALLKSYDNSAKKITGGYSKKDLSTNLKLKMTNIKGSAKRLNSHSPCLKFILNQNLIETNNIVSDLGYENYSLLKESRLISLGPPNRANRQIMLDWYPRDESKYMLKASTAEAVFGQHIPPILEQVISLKHQNSNFNFEDQLNISVFLKTESTALKVDDQPMISKIYRAWVYVDKGKAWGLRVGDRLITTSQQGAKITGHVVAFFGPNMGIKSPRGFEINEGAIIYIRKGQTDTILGQKFSWDTKSFPTPWPPR